MLHKFGFHILLTTSPLSVGQLLPQEPHGADDDVEQLKENIATKGKHIDDLQGKLDALKKVTHIVNSKSEKHQRR